MEGWYGKNISGTIDIAMQPLRHPRISTWILFSYSFLFSKCGYGPLIGDGSFALLNNVSFAPIDYADSHTNYSWCSNCGICCHHAGFDIWKYRGTHEVPSLLGVHLIMDGIRLMILSLIGSGEMAGWIRELDHMILQAAVSYTLVQAYRLWWRPSTVGKPETTVRSNHNIPMTIDWCRSSSIRLVRFSTLEAHWQSTTSPCECQLHPAVSHYASSCCGLSWMFCEWLILAKAEQQLGFISGIVADDSITLDCRFSSVRSLPLWSDWSAVSFVSTVSPFWRKKYNMMMRLMHSVALRLSAESGAVATGIFAIHKFNQPAIEGGLLDRILDFWLQVISILAHRLPTPVLYLISFIKTDQPIHATNPAQEEESDWTMPYMEKLLGNISCPSRRTFEFRWICRTERIENGLPKIFRSALSRVKVPNWLSQTRIQKTWINR